MAMVPDRIRESATDSQGIDYLHEEEFEALMAQAEKAHKMLTALKKPTRDPLSATF